MDKETLQKAKDISENIESHRKSVDFLEKFLDSGCIFYIGADMENMAIVENLHFEPWEIRLMIHQKKQRIEALERQLEDL